MSEDLHDDASRAVDPDAESDAIHETGDAVAGADFGKASSRRTFALYALIIGVGFAVLEVLLHIGRGLHAPAPADGGVPSAKEAVDVHHVFWKLLLAIALVIVAARVVGALFRRIGQPQVMGEIVAGIVLGPSVLGALWPSAQHAVFTPDVLPFIDVLAQVGLVFFMFLIGVELDMRLIRGRGEAAALVSHVSIVAPFLSGVAVAVVIFSRLGSADGSFTPFALFLGASMSITAFPVLARILNERGLHKTRLGTVTLTCAAVDDVTAWCLLAIVVAIASASGIASALITIGLAAAFIALMIIVVRPLLARIDGYFEDNDRMSGTMLAFILVGLMLSALATDRIGIHAIFGAFLFGAVMPHHSTFISELTNKLEDFAVIFLLPLFFAFSGLRTEIGQLGADPQLWMFCGLIVLVAVIGKWGGSSIAARAVGLTWRESAGLGILMNCRGLTELVILNIGLDLGVIPPTLFAMLVIMALVTTFMTTPILGRVYPPEEQERMIAEEGGAAEEGERVFRVLVHVANMDRAYELVHAALAMAATDEGVSTQVVLLRTLQMGDGYYRAGSLRATSRADAASRALRPLVEFVEGAGCAAVPIVMQTSSTADAIVRVVADRRPDLVLVHMAKPLFGRRLLATSIGRVLRDADADVVLALDPRGRGFTPGRDGTIVVPFGGGFHEEAALELGVRVGSTTGARLHLVTDGDEDRAHVIASRAADAYERAGVWAAADAAEGDVTKRLLDAARSADLVVLGVGDTWAADQQTLGSLRELVAEHIPTPMLVVRRAGQQRRRFGRRDGEWMEESTGEIDLRERADGGASLGSQPPSSVR
jgi:Kef-type K+ transport system membrane component KefB/nucleotide-binding universal stress UspA family protein